MTVTELGHGWLASDPSKRASTYKWDEAIIRRHINPKLGPSTIAKVTKDRVQSLVNEWSKDHAPRTVQRQYDVLRAMFTYAADNDLLSRSPCRNIKEPESPQGTHRSLTSDDVAAIADATVNEYRPMVYVGAVLGLRWGEVAALRGRLPRFGSIACHSRSAARARPDAWLSEVSSRCAHTYDAGTVDGATTDARHYQRAHRGDGASVFSSRGWAARLHELATTDVVDGSTCSRPFDRSKIGLPWVSAPARAMTACASLRVP
jgi:hypothetical protein